MFEFIVGGSLLVIAVCMVAVTSTVVNAYDPINRRWRK